ncbi:MAG: tetratricopeptide repeat protein [Betaproteobacteria bacterium]|nr:tetratricopeptide repeat protein [Betaproteobacteria bacterium]
MNLVRAGLLMLAMSIAGASLAQPDTAREAFNRGITAGAAGGYGKAIGYFSEALRLDPAFARAWYNRGLAYQHIGQNDRALKDYSEAIRLEPGYAAAYANRGSIYHHLEQHERAIKDYNEAIRLDPNQASAYANRGLSYIRLGQHGRAAADLGEAIRLDPRDADSHDSLAWLLATSRATELRDGKRAVEFAARAVELTQFKEPAYLDTLAAAYARMGDFSSAIKWQLRALSDPQFAKNKEAQERLQLYRASRPFPPE